MAHCSAGIPSKQTCRTLDLQLFTAPRGLTREKLLRPLSVFVSKEKRT